MSAQLQAAWPEMDRLQVAMQALPQVDCPLTHRFTPGLYCREIFMPKGSLIISKIHKTEHQFAVLQGSVAVWLDGKIERLSSPYIGVTKPGTRRLLYILEDCIWATFHPTTLTDVTEIEREIIEPHDCGQLPDGDPAGALLKLMEATP